MIISSNTRFIFIFAFALRLVYSRQFPTSDHKSSLIFPPLIDGHHKQHARNSAAKEAASSSRELPTRLLHSTPCVSDAINRAADSNAAALLSYVSNTTRSGLRGRREKTEECEVE
jgi:hypothetical protein